MHASARFLPMSSGERKNWVERSCNVNEKAWKLVNQISGLCSVMNRQRLNSSKSDIFGWRESEKDRKSSLSTNLNAKTSHATDKNVGNRHLLHCIGSEDVQLTRVEILKVQLETGTKRVRNLINLWLVHFVRHCSLQLGKARKKMTLAGLPRSCSKECSLLDRTAIIYNRPVRDKRLTTRLGILTLPPPWYQFPSFRLCNHVSLCGCHRSRETSEWARCWWIEKAPTIQRWCTKCYVSVNPVSGPTNYLRLSCVALVILTL